MPEEKKKPNKFIYTKGDFKITRKGKKKSEPVEEKKEEETGKEKELSEMPWKVEEKDGEYCVFKEGSTDPLKCYPTRGEALDYQKALYANTKEEHMVSGFQWVELGQSTLGAFEGLAASHDVAFVSMSGEELFVEPEDLEAYMRNGMAVIDSTRTASGNVVGLPIDKSGHDHKGGAGWIKGFELDRGRNIVTFLVEWTDEGVNLIKSNLARFFSPTIDPINKVILGGSLTNWPATRNSLGQLLLKPIELSKSMKGITMPTIEETLAAISARLDVIEKGITPADKTATTSPVPDEDKVELEIQNLLGDDSALDQLGELAQAKAKEIIRVSQRKSHVIEFVSKVVGGTPDHPVGLPVTARELTKLLLSLPEKQSLHVERILAKVWDGALDFAEHGIQTGDNFNLRRPVPAMYVDLLRTWVDSGKSPKSFFETNPEAGSAEDFNLTPFIVKEA